MAEKMVLIALNAKYAHTSLAVRSIYTYVKSKGDFDISYRELTINDEYFYLLNEILKDDPHIIGFATYIWNVELVKKLVSDIKSINSNITVFLGGPEVTYNKNVFSEIKDIDFVVKGEGEVPILEYLKGNKSEQGIWYKGKETDFAKMLPLDDIPFVYTKEDLSELKNRAVYYETSRGCPFKCAFCISSLTKGVRTLSLERVFKEIDMFIDAKIKRVKLVDRTFNFDVKRAKAIIDYITKKSKDTCFHFEIGADLLDDELIDMINNAKRDVIQFEAGIQSINEKTLLSCDRKTNMEKLSKNLLALCNSKPRIHVDLIAGLPYENYESFKNSFNEVYKLEPDVLQVGFLKLLHGSKLRNEKEKYNYKFKSTAPYEVLSNDFINFKELTELKKVDKSVDCYKNSEFFKYSLKYIENKDIKPYTFFHRLGDNMGNIKMSLKDKFLVLLETYKSFFDDDNKFSEYLKLDYCLKQRGALPEFFNNYKTKEFIGKLNEFLNDKEKRETYLPLYKDKSKSEISKNVDFEVFFFDNKKKLLAFDRKNNIVIDLSSIL